MLVAGYYGVDLTGMLTGEPVSQQQTTTQRSVSPQEEQAAKFTKVILADTEDTWALSSKDGPSVPAEAGALSRRHADRSRYRPVRYGTVLLPG